MSLKWQNIAERAGWTAAQAVLGVLVVEVGNLPLWWAAPVATGLSMVKTWVTHQDPDPAEVPAPPTFPGG